MLADDGVGMSKETAGKLNDRFEKILYSKDGQRNRACECVGPIVTGFVIQYTSMYSSAFILAGTMGIMGPFPLHFLSKTRKSKLTIYSMVIRKHDMMVNIANLSHRSCYG